MLEHFCNNLMRTGEVKDQKNQDIPISLHKDRKKGKEKTLNSTPNFIYYKLLKKGIQLLVCK